MDRDNAVYVVSKAEEGIKFFDDDDDDDDLLFFDWIFQHFSGKYNATRGKQAWVGMNSKND